MMKKRGLMRLLLIAAAVLCCAGIALYTRLYPARHTQGITLWYTQSDCPQALMDSLLKLCRQETGTWVEGVCFEDERALGAAFERGRPDLLFCGHIRAAQLDGRESLGAISSPLPIPAKLGEVRPAVGTSFFPVGSRLPLLLVNTAHWQGDLPDFETLLAAAEDEPFIISDCWAEVLYTECAASGYTMTGLAAEDGQSESYAGFYNLLAEAAFRGALVSGENAADYALQGALPCAVTWSTALASIPRNDPTFRALPLPLPEGGEAAYPAELMGFALLGDADTEAAERFLQWLWHGRGQELAFAAGLVPIADACTGRGADSALGQLLVTLAEPGKLSWPDADGSFFQNREACERDLRETLDLLT